MNNISSFHTSPLTSNNKQNVCPNPRNSSFSRLKPFIKQQTPSQDHDFNTFRTIQVVRGSNGQSMTTKSKAQLEAIIENFSTRSQSRKKFSEHSHKSFLALLGLAFGKEQESISVDEAIEKCQQYEISGRQQLISMIEEKQPSREWPLPLSNMLLTDLGKLKVTRLCQTIQNQQQLSNSQLQILQFLLPNLPHFQVLDRSTVLQCYNEFLNKITEKSDQVDELVKQYTLTVQKKIRAVKDKVALVKMSKKIKKFQQLHEGKITFGQLEDCIELFGLSQQEKVVAFRYFYFIENEKILELVDRKLTVNCQTCYQQLLQKDNSTKNTMMIHSSSVSSLYEQQNTNIINQLLSDKHHLLLTLTKKNQQLQQLQSQIALLKFDLQQRQKQHLREKDRQVNNVKAKYTGVIASLEADNANKDRIIKWYQGELDALVQEKQQEYVSSNRPEVFYQVVKSTEGISTTGRDRPREEQESSEEGQINEESYYDI